MWRAALIPVVIGLITWVILQFKIYFEEKIAERKQKPKKQKSKEPVKLYDHNYPAEDDDK